MSGKTSSISQPVLLHLWGEAKVGGATPAWTWAVSMTGLEVVACGSRTPSAGGVWPSVAHGQRNYGCSQAPVALWLGWLLRLTIRTFRVSTVISYTLFLFILIATEIRTIITPWHQQGKWICISKGNTRCSNTQNYQWLNTVSFFPSPQTTSGVVAFHMAFGDPSPFHLEEVLRAFSSPPAGREKPVEVTTGQAWMGHMCLPCTSHWLESVPGPLLASRA